MIKKFMASYTSEYTGIKSLSQFFNIISLHLDAFSPSLFQFAYPFKEKSSCWSLNYTFTASLTPSLLPKFLQRSCLSKYLFFFFFIIFFLGLCIIMGKQPLPHGGLMYWPSKFVLATLVKGHYMIIYANLQSNLPISFWGDDFQRINMHHYDRKNSPAPVGASFIDGASLF